MAEFTYTGVDRRGKRVQGKMEAPSEGELRMMLRGQGIRPTKITKASVLNTDLGAIFRGGKMASVPIKDLALFTRQLQVLIGSGIPMVQSLEVLTDQMTNPSFKSIMTACRAKVSQGSYLWEALATYKRSFPRVYLALMRAGESSGALDQMLERLADYLESTDKIVKMVKSAMMYPAFVVTIAVGVIFIMLTFVIPKFEELLASSGAELPALTQGVIDVSHFMVDNIQIIFVGGGAAAFMGLRYFKSSEGRALFQRFMFRLPVFGEIAMKSGIARFTRTLGTLLSAGVNLIDALEICRVTVDNIVIEEAMKTMRRDVEAGKTVSNTLNKIKVFPKMAVQMISVGESTGNMESMLEKIADMYESDVEQLVGGLSKLIEPIILVVLGGIVAGLMLAMYLPIFKMAQNV